MELVGISTQMETFTKECGIEESSKGTARCCIKMVDTTEETGKMIFFMEEGSTR